MKNWKPFLQLVMLLHVTSVSAQVPQVINYQGRIDSSGLGINGPRNITFRIYADSSRTNLRWTGSYVVPFDDGIFDVSLGTHPAFFPADLFDGSEDRWLGITVGGVELMESLKFTSVAYALQSATVRDSAITASKIADGSVTMAKINPSNADSGHVIKWNGSAWMPGVDNEGLGTQWKMNGIDVYYSSGKVGVGTSNIASESGNLTVARTVSILGSGDDREGGEIRLANPNDSSGSGLSGWVIDNFDGNLRFIPDNYFTAVLIDDSTGNVGIGVDNPVAPLQVDGGVDVDLDDTTGYLIVGPSSAGTEIAIDDNEIQARNSGDASPLHFQYSGGNVAIGGVTATNILTIESGVPNDPIADKWNTWSSLRWKEDVHPIQGALGKIQQLRGVTFVWKKSKDPDIGLIAEEVGAVLPEVVDYEENGIDAKGLDYARIVAVLVEAIKEQQRQIEKQQVQIDELRSK